MAAYNRRDVLVEALGFIIENDFPKEEYEIIIGDNNSTDGTKQRIEQFCKDNAGKVNIKYLVETRKGNVYARHSAVKNANGKYLVFCDDDCFVAKNWLSEINRVFNLHPEIGLLGTRIEILWDKTPPSWIKPYQPQLGEISSPVPLRIEENNFYVNSGSMAISKELFEEVKGTLPEQIGEYYVGDGETGLCKKLHALNKPIAITNQTFVSHYQLVAKNGGIKDIKRRHENNGICEAFHEVYRLKKVNIDNVLWNRNERRKSMLKSILTLNFTLARQSYFQYHFYKKKYEFIDVFTKQSTNISKDWELNDKYIASPIVYSSVFERKF